MEGAALVAAPEAPYVGRSVPRVEDRPLLTGRGRYVDDVHRGGTLVARVVRSEVAHGRIRSIGADAARRRPGVVEVITGADIPEMVIPVRLLPSDDGATVTQSPLAREVVRYVGEPVAVVVAEDPYVAEDVAAELEIEIEPLEPLLDALEAARPDAPAIHPGAPAGNVLDHLHAVHGRPVDELFAGAAAVVRERLRVHRHAAIPLETRGLVAEFDPEERRLTVWGPTKVKHFNRTMLAGFLGLEETDIRFLEPDVGGGFGARGEFYPEDFLVPWLAVRLGRPVKWTEDRREHFTAINHSRQVWCDLEMAADADGRLLGFRATCRVDQGAYARTHGTLLMPWILVHHLPGPYLWEGFEIDAASVVTHKTPSGTYRGPGQYEAAFFRERMLELLARELGIDAAELRRRNLVPLERMPLRMEIGDAAPAIVYDGGDFPRLFATLVERSGYAELRAEVDRRRADGELVGLGFGAFVEETSFGRYEYAHVVPEPDGRFVAYVGVASLGQGVRTALSQVVADGLEVPIERVKVVHDDTDLVPQGFGAFASRATLMGGSAALGAIDDLRRRAVAAAADRLEIAEADLEIAPGGLVRPRGNPSRAIPMAELGCEGSHRFEKRAPGFDMGACLATVEVDRETGEPTVTRLSICQDVGRIVNPQLAHGQLVGAAVQGVGGTLLEELAYDPSGQPLATSFMDYLMPTAAEAPQIDALPMELPHHDPATENPLRVKSAGEGGIIGSGAAIANAVADAVGGDGRAGCRLPVRPEELLRRLGGGDHQFADEGA